MWGVRGNLSLQHQGMAAKAWRMPTMIDHAGVRNDGCAHTQSLDLKTVLRGKGKK